MENIGIIIFIKENEFISKKVYFDETDKQKSDENIILNEKTISSDLLDLYKNQILNGYHISYFFRGYSYKREKGAFKLKFQEKFSNLNIVLNIEPIPLNINLYQIRECKKELQEIYYNTLNYYKNEEIIIEPNNIFDISFGGIAKSLNDTLDLLTRLEQKKDKIK